MSKKETRFRARLEILNYVVQFLTQNWYGNSTTSVMEDIAFHNSQYNPPIGSIVKLFCAPTTKWYLSWVIDKKEDKVLLESIEDGERCWWYNVGYYHIPLEKIANNPTWKYTDRQFDFKDKWFRACSRMEKYDRAPCLPIFLESGNVLLKVRKRYVDNKIVEKEFPNWKTLTSKTMQDFYSNIDFINV